MMQFSILWALALFADIAHAHPTMSRPSQTASQVTSRPISLSNGGLKGLESAIQKAEAAASTTKTSRPSTASKLSLNGFDSAIQKAEAAASTAKTPASSASIVKSSTSSAPSVWPSVNCDDGTWDLTVDNWLKFQTDKALHTWWFGGKAPDGFTYSGNHTDPLTQSLAETVEPTGSSLLCTLEAHACQPAETCDLFEVHLDKQAGPPVHWGWFAVHSISNVWAFATSFYNGVTNAGVYTADLNLDLTKVFTKPSKNPEFFTRDILLGFSFVVTAAFAFVPVVGEIAEVPLTAAVLSGIGSSVSTTVADSGGFLGNTLAAGTEDLATKAADFGAYMGTVFDSTQAGVDKFIQQLMAGENIGGQAGGNPTLLDVIGSGQWISQDILKNSQTGIPAITTLLQKDFIQRGINHIWLQSKIWVSYANLNDDAATSKCLNDRNGWQASKTCLHGGVYYLYRFDERGNEAGSLDYPWGADKMSSAPWNLSPAWVTHSSAMAYRSQNNGVGGFNYDYTKAPTNLESIFQAVADTHSFDNLNALEGVWNISVCDMGTHADWNNDFTSAQPYNAQWSPYGDMAFPCCCGPQCSQTKDFIQSAQMNNFDTIYSNCKTQLQSCDAWPPGATEVDFGGAGVITKKSPNSDNQCVY